MTSYTSTQVRRRSVAVQVGSAVVGGSAPVVVQSMTNTDTADIEATAKQVAELSRAGSELVRITVNTPEAAAAVPHIRDRLAFYAERTGDKRLAPAPLLSRLAAEGQGFASLKPPKGAAA